MAFLLRPTARLLRGPMRLHPRLSTGGCQAGPLRTALSSHTPRCRATPRPVRLPACVPVAHLHQHQHQRSGSGEGEDEGQRETEGGSGVLGKLQTAMVQHPRESLISFGMLEIFSMGLNFGLIKLSGVPISPEFGLAFALSRPLRRVRLPVELAVAAGIIKVFPGLARVKLASVLQDSSPAFAAMKARQLKDIEENKAGMVSRGVHRLTGVIDQYGAGYFIAARVVGVAIILSLYAGLRVGVDLTPLLQRLGAETAGEVVATWAAAVTLSSALYPITMACTAYTAPALARMLRRR